VLACVGDFYAFAEAQYFYLLVKMLAVEVHEVAGLVLAEASV